MNWRRRGGVERASLRGVFVPLTIAGGCRSRFLAADWKPSRWRPDALGKNGTRTASPDVVNAGTLFSWSNAAVGPFCAVSRLGCPDDECDRGMLPAIVNHPRRANLFRNCRRERRIDAKRRRLGQALVGSSDEFVRGANIDEQMSNEPSLSGAFDRPQRKVALPRSSRPVLAVSHPRKICC